MGREHFLMFPRFRNRIWRSRAGRFNNILRLVDAQPQDEIILMLAC